MINALVEVNFHLIFLNEFLVNRNTLKSYDWVKKGQPGRKTMRLTDFKMSLIVAHSPTKIEGIVDTNTTINQTKYAHFLKMLVLKLKDDPEIESRRLVIAADN